ncbi:MAG: hypothetical protein R3F17_04115 [Planctomycetota bacterium]
MHLAFASEGKQPETVREHAAPRAPFELYDRHGQALALSVECFDLSVSPRSLWRSHTPEKLAASMAQVLGIDVDPLLEQLLPREFDAAQGFVVPVAPRLLRFRSDQVNTVQRWLERGTLDPKAEAVPMAGWDWKVLEGGREATLMWDPRIVLGVDERVRHLGKGAEKRPDRWTRRFLRDLSTLVAGFGLPADVREDLDRLTPFEARAALADRIWAESCPTTFRVVERSIDPRRAHAPSELLSKEAVSSYQVQLEPSMRRAQPVRSREDGLKPMGKAAESPEDSFGVLGHWGVLGAEAAKAQALRDRENAPHLLAWDSPADPLEARADELANERKPWSGIERLCSDLFEASGLEQEWQLDPRSHRTRHRQVARDRRLRWPDRRVQDTSMGWMPPTTWCCCTAPSTPICSSGCTRNCST